VQVTLVKSAPTRVQPAKLTRSSVAPAKSGSRSRQFSNVTSVSVPERKLTESSLLSRNVTRRSALENAGTPASAHPVSVMSCQPVSARSVATNRTSAMVTPVNRVFRSRPPSNETLRNTQSMKWQFPAAAASNAASANSTRSYGSSASRSPSCRMSSTGDLPAFGVSAMRLTVPAPPGPPGA
jgi:hypothetical protein